MIKNQMIIKIFLLTVITMLTLSVGYITTKANETDAKYTGTYDTGFVRTLWAYCYNASLKKRMHPAAATAYCDCIIDSVRVELTRDQLDNSTSRIEAFTRYAEMCGIKLFGAPTPTAGSLTQARQRPAGVSKWLDALLISHYQRNLALPRVQEDES
tara:strand:+ start:295 stop:762 length:468 start_codon:yes stop_codon:yes gene_type:complete